MRPEKPMDRPTYLEWSKTLPTTGCMLCDYREHQIILKEYYNWVWVYSVAPYKKLNSMLVPKRHIEHFSELKDFEVKEFMKIHDELYEIFHTVNDTSEYIWMWRTRDPNFGITRGQKLGKRLDHLHVHFIPEATRWLDPIIYPDASDEEAFNSLRSAAERYYETR